jgi:hypothetical protein
LVEIVFVDYDLKGTLLIILQNSKGMEGYVGFANLPNQVFRKSVKKGFEFTVMVVGKLLFGCTTCKAQIVFQNMQLFWLVFTNSLDLHATG